MSTDEPNQGELVAHQLGTVWEGMLSQMTAQGASRDDLIETTARTCAVILETTGGALWPAGLATGLEVPHLENLHDAGRKLAESIRLIAGEGA